MTLGEMLKANKYRDMMNLLIYADEGHLEKNEEVIRYDYHEHRHPDDGSYADPLREIPEKYLNREVDSWYVSESCEGHPVIVELKKF